MNKRTRQTKVENKTSEWDQPRGEPATDGRCDRYDMAVSPR
jgi:hypothetical protein